MPRRRRRHAVVVFGFGLLSCWLGLGRDLFCLSSTVGILGSTVLGSFSSLAVLTVDIFAVFVVLIVILDFAILRFCFWVGLRAGPCVGARQDDQQEQDQEPVHGGRPLPSPGWAGQG